MIVETACVYETAARSPIVRRSPTTMSAYPAAKNGNGPRAAPRALWPGRLVAVHESPRSEARNEEVGGRIAPAPDFLSG